MFKRPDFLHKACFSSVKQTSVSHCTVYLGCQNWKQAQAPGSKTGQQWRFVQGWLVTQTLGRTGASGSACNQRLLRTQLFLRVQCSVSAPLPICWILHLSPNWLSLVSDLHEPVQPHAEANWQKGKPCSSPQQGPPVPSPAGGKWLEHSVAGILSQKALPRVCTPHTSEKPEQVPGMCRPFARRCSQSSMYLSLNWTNSWRQ